MIGFCESLDRIAVHLIARLDPLFKADLPVGSDTLQKIMCTPPAAVPQSPLKKA